MDNPYTPPETESTAPAKIKLFSPGHVAWATFLGAPIAGCILMAMNYRRLGKRSASQIAIVWGILGTILLLAVSFVLPESFPSSILPAACTMSMYACMKSLQGDTIETQLASGGQKASSWAATGIGILCMILLLTTMLAVVLVLPDEWFVEEM